MLCSLAASRGFFLKQSQDECPDPTQTLLGHGWNAPDQGRCLGLFCSGVSAHRALPTPLHGCLPWETYQDPEGHGASLALCCLLLWGLIDLPHVGPLQAVLETLDVLLTQKVRSR